MSTTATDTDGPHGELSDADTKSVGEVVFVWVFRILEIISGGLIITASILDLDILHRTPRFRLVIVNVYLLLFGFWVILANFVIPKFLVVYIPFYMNGMGRGAFLFFVGAVSLGHNGVHGPVRNVDIHIASGVFVLTTSFLHIITWTLVCFEKMEGTVPLPLINTITSEDLTSNSIRRERLIKSNTILGVSLHVLNFFAGLCTLFFGVLFLFSGATDFSLLVIAAFYVVFGLIIIIFEFFIPYELQTQIPFYLNFGGRSAFFLFLGGLILGRSPLELISGVLALTCSFVYFNLWVGSRADCCCEKTKMGLPAPLCTSSKIEDDDEYYEDIDEGYDNVDEETQAFINDQSRKSRRSREYEDSPRRAASLSAASSSRHEDDFVGVTEDVVPPEQYDRNSSVGSSKSVRDEILTFEPDSPVEQHETKRDAGSRQEEIVAVNAH